MTDPSPLVATERLLAFPTPADPDDAYENRIHIPNADRWQQGGMDLSFQDVQSVVKKQQATHWPPAEKFIGNKTFRLFQL